MGGRAEAHNEVDTAGSVALSAPELSLREELRYTRATLDKASMAAPGRWKFASNATQAVMRGAEAQRLRRTVVGTWKTLTGEK